MKAVPRAAVLPLVLAVLAQPQAAFLGAQTDVRTQLGPDQDARGLSVQSVVRPPASAWAPQEPPGLAQWTQQRPDVAQRVLPVLLQERQVAWMEQSSAPLEP